MYLKRRYFSLSEEPDKIILFNNRVILKKGKPLKLFKWLGKTIPSVGKAQSKYLSYNIYLNGDIYGYLELESINDFEVELCLWKKDPNDDIELLKKIANYVLKKLKSLGYNRVWLVNTGDDTYKKIASFLKFEVKNPGKSSEIYFKNI